MPLQAVARLIQTMLYGRRFFPFYVYIILGGIEEDGTRHRTSRSHTHRPTFFLFPGSGSVYSFDPVGSYERETCRAAGAAQSLLQPFLDNQVCLMPTRRRPAAASAAPRRAGPRRCADLAPPRHTSHSASARDNNVLIGSV